MKRLLAPLALLPLFAIVNFTACSDDGGGAATTGGDLTPATCQDAPLCDPVELPSYCAFDGASLDCTGPDGGSVPDGGTATDAGASDAGADGSHLSPVQTARLQCTLEALRDRRAGGLTALTGSNSADLCGARVEIVSFGDGSASVLPVTFCGGSVARGKAARRAIQPVAFFEECLTSTEEAKRVQCLAKAMTTKTVSGGVCSCRGIHDDPYQGLCTTE